MAAIRKGKRPPLSVNEIDEIEARAKYVGVAPVPEGRVAGRPLTNRGGSGTLSQPVRVSVEIPRVGGLVLTDAGVRIVPQSREGSGEACFIDYASLTFGEGAVRRLIDGCKPFTDQEHAGVIGIYARDALLGIKCEITVMRSGIFGYQAGVKIGDYGIAAAGGNGASCFVSFTGHAFAVANEGFPDRLYKFLIGIGSAQLTRIDIAYDDMEGRLFPVRNIPDRWRSGEFSAPRAPRLPKFQQYGSWLADDPEGAGLTAYIGARASGKWIRIYEKGKQLGDVTSPWVRAEAELRNNVFSLVPKMLINPSNFFVMLCPAFSSIAYQGKPAKLDRQATEALATLDAVLDTIKTQYGGYLDVLRKENYFESDSELLDRVCRVPKVVPPVLRRLNNLTEVALNAEARFLSQSAELETGV